MKKSHVIALIAAVLAAILLIAPLSEPVEAAVVLGIGSRGENVRKVQQKLVQFGYASGTPDGVYGQNTYSAVRRFQQRNGLAVDGRVGPQTAAALGVTLSSSGSTAASSSSSSDLRLLARLVQSEAGTESYKGKVAVAAVVLNRVKSSQFPNTISGVIYQKNAFSVVNNGKINNTPSDESIRAAREAMNGWDPTGGCLYFYNARLTSDQWLRTRTVKTVIGRHTFAI